MKDFRNLQVWHKAHEVALATYRASAPFPKEEIYGLTSQMRRSAASIAANICEGCGRRGSGDFHRFLQIAMGSASELEYHLLLARDLGYLAIGEYQELNPRVLEVKKMLASLIVRVGADRVR
jgi:four helix bundle protein